MELRVAPISSICKTNRYTPKKVRDQSEMVQKAVRFNLSVNQPVGIPQKKGSLDVRV